MERIFDLIMQNNKRFYIIKEDKPLLSIYKKRGSKRKSYVIHALKKRITFLNRRNELIFLVSMGYVTERIEKSIPYTVLSFSNYKAKNLYTKMSRYRFINFHSSLISWV